MRDKHSFDRLIDVAKNIAKMTGLLLTESYGAILFPRATIMVEQAH